jgi:hypothetical protein
VKSIGGVPVHEPADAVSFSPTTAVPEIVGGDTFDGVAADRASAPVVSMAATPATHATSTAAPANAPRSLPWARPVRMGSDIVTPFPRFSPPTCPDWPP